MEYGLKEITLNGGWRCYLKCGWDSQDFASNRGAGLITEKAGRFCIRKLEAANPAVKTPHMPQKERWPVPPCRNALSGSEETGVGGRSVS